MRNDLTWLDINDFTPGIHEIYSSQMPPGAALNTSYGCWANTRNGLTGLPSRDIEWVPTDFGAYSAPSDTLYKIVGFLVIPAIDSNDPLDFGAGDGNAAAIIPRADDSLGAGSNHSILAYFAFEAVNDRLGPVQRHNALCTAAFCDDDTNPPFTNIHAAFTTTRIEEDDEVAHTYLQFARSVGDHTVAFARSPLQPGSPVVVAGAIPLAGGGEWIGSGDMYMIMTPDPTVLPNAFSPTTLDFGPGGAVTAAMPVGRVLIHQGRILAAVYEYWGRYDDSSVPNGGGVTTNDLIYWTESNAANAEFQGVFGDKPFGFGVWASLTSSDLFIVTHNNGAILVQGDLNAPVVRRYPGVQPTNGLECDGATTPIGFVYGSGGGSVYAWKGGDTSTNLSPQMSDQFWVPESAVDHRSHKGSFANWGDLILAPGGWCMDIGTGAWWMLDSYDEDNNEPPVLNWQVSPSGASAYGTPAYIPNVAGAAGIAMYSYDKFQRRSNWIWNSHPFVTTAWRTVEVHEAVLICIADVETEYSVTVIDGDTGAFAQAFFTHPGDGRMKAIKKDLGQRTYNMRVRIQQLSGDGEVMGLRIGYVERQEQRKGT